jgi:hypothetical protein
MSPLNQAFMLTFAALIIGVGIVGVMNQHHASAPLATVSLMSGDDMGTSGRDTTPIQGGQDGLGN